MVAEIGKPARKVLDAVSNVQHVDPGYLVFSRERTLVAQRFDAASRGVRLAIPGDRCQNPYIGRRRNVAAMEPRRARAVVPRRGSPTRLHPGSNGSDVDRRRSTPSVRREERPQVG